MKFRGDSMATTNSHGCMRYLVGPCIGQRSFAAARKRLRSCRIIQSEPNKHVNADRVVIHFNKDDRFCDERVSSMDQVRVLTVGHSAIREDGIEIDASLETAAVARLPSSCDRSCECHIRPWSTAGIAILVLWALFGHDSCGCQVMSRLRIVDAHVGDSAVAKDSKTMRRKLQNVLVVHMRDSK
jgi:hypothetical protein